MVQMRDSIRLPWEFHHVLCKPHSSVRLQVQCWIHWNRGLELDDPVDDRPNNPACQLVWHELRGMSIWKVQSIHRAIRSNPSNMPSLQYRHVLHRPGCFQQYPMHAMPGGHVPDRHRHAQPAGLLAVQCWDVSNRDRHHSLTYVLAMSAGHVPNRHWHPRLSHVLPVQSRDVPNRHWRDGLAGMLVMRVWDVPNW